MKTFHSRKIAIPGFRVRQVNLSVKMQVQFNQFIIQKNWSKINRTPIQRAGVKVMYTMRGLIRKARKTKSGERSRKPSLPGKPPRAHEGRGGSWPFKLIFSVPLRPWQVVVGHKGFGKSQTPMEIHEFGQTARVKIVRRLRRRRKARSEAQRKAARRLFKAGRIKEKNASWTIVEQSVKYPKRPFAKPALLRTKTKIPKLWRNAVSSATVRGV